MNKIFIIGNGFDLNLGFKTSYLDYVNSDEFRFMNTNNSSNELAKYLMRRVEIQKWVDFEVALKEYVLETRPNSNKLRIEYNEVVKGLESYLNKINTDKDMQIEYDNFEEKNSSSEFSLSSSDLDV